MFPPMMAFEAELDDVIASLVPRLESISEHSPDPAMRERADRIMLALAFVQRDAACASCSGLGRFNDIPCTACNATGRR